MQPLMMLVFPGLRDRGYAFGRISALLLIALFSWWAGFAGLTFSRTTISLVIAGILVLNVVLAGSSGMKSSGILKPRASTY